MGKFKNSFLWMFLRSYMFVVFMIFLTFFLTIAYIGERRKNGRNTKNVHVMKEDVLYIRPVGFEEKQPNDTIIDVVE